MCREPYDLADIIVAELKERWPQLLFRYGHYPRRHWLSTETDSCYVVHCYGCLRLGLRARTAPLRLDLNDPEMMAKIEEYVRVNLNP